LAVSASFGSDTNTEAANAQARVNMYSAPVPKKYFAVVCFRRCSEDTTSLSNMVSPFENGTGLYLTAARVQINAGAYSAAFGLINRRSK
jgi:hypothetical protein